MAAGRSNEATKHGAGDDCEYPQGSCGERTDDGVDHDSTDAEHEAEQDNIHHAKRNELRWRRLLWHQEGLVEQTGDDEIQHNIPDHCQDDRNREDRTGPIRTQPAIAGS